MEVANAGAALCISGRHWRQEVIYSLKNLSPAQYSFAGKPADNLPLNSITNLKILMPFPPELPATFDMDKILAICPAARTLGLF